MKTYIFEYNDIQSFILINITKFCHHTHEYIYVYIFMYTYMYLFIYMYIYYIYINCAVNMGLTVSEKSVFPTSFSHGHFQGNLFSFEKHKWLHKILFDVICLEICHNGVAFFLTAVDEN